MRSLRRWLSAGSLKTTINIKELIMLITTLLEGLLIVTVVAIVAAAVR